MGSSQRRRDRQNALDAAAHAYAIKRALELSRNEVEQQALVRFGPVPAMCQRCREHPPRVIQMTGSGVWLCRRCAGLENKQ
jgi:4-diphosphocytidyl-2C-methyl-D-erythritol kinase